MVACTQKQIKQKRQVLHKTVVPNNSQMACKQALRITPPRKGPIRRVFQNMF